jgi:hypothetical protein
MISSCLHFWRNDDKNCYLGASEHGIARCWGTIGQENNRGVKEKALLDFYGRGIYTGIQHNPTISVLNYDPTSTVSIL